MDVIMDGIQWFIIHWLVQVLAWFLAIDALLMVPKLSKMWIDSILLIKNNTVLSSILLIPFLCLGLSWLSLHRFFYGGCRKTSRVGA